MTNHDPADQAKIDAMAADTSFQTQAREVFQRACDYRYSYNFKWLGRPIIQFPEDILAIQELLWQVRPELVIETGIAHGGSLILSASILELIGGSGRVLGIDIDIREHNRQAILAHPMAKRIDMIEGSSVDAAVAAKVQAAAAGKSPVMVFLDSNHTHEHVLRELELYASLVSRGSWLVVFDTVVEFMREDAFPDRPWGRGDNPYTAVQEFLKSNDRFVLDSNFENKLLMSVAEGGWLRCVKD